MNGVGERQLDWEGCFNVRDLGGLPTMDGRVTRRRAVVRADALDGLTDAAPRPATVSTVQLPLDVAEDREFWSVWGTGPQFGTPLYYRPHLDRFPERSAAVLAAIAGAEPGGVAFHCVGGRDRTGQVTMLALALVGVAPADIAADYELSTERLRARYAAHGEEDQGPLLESFLAEQGTTASELIIATLAALDVETRLRTAGLKDQELAALRHRLVIA